jgi:hypothetical protein
MKNIILICICAILVSSFKTIEKTPITDGDFYNVMATSGLKMRATPNGKKLLTIPYNGQVEKINDGKDYGNLTVTELKDFKIKGKWIKVKYDGKEGFVFDGYLTKLPLPDKGIVYEQTEKYSGHIEYYIKRKFKPSSISYWTEKFGDCEPKEKNCICATKQNFFDNKIIYRNTWCQELGVQEDFDFKDITLAEIYSISKVIYNNMSDDMGESDYTFNKKKNSFLFETKEDGAGCRMEINKKKNIFSVDSYCGC